MGEIEIEIEIRNENKNKRAREEISRQRKEMKIPRLNRHQDA